MPLSTGVKDPLLAKALVLRQGDVRAAIVCCDLIGVPRAIALAARVLFDCTIYRDVLIVRFLYAFRDLFYLQRRLTPDGIADAARCPAGGWSLKVE